MSGGHFDYAYGRVQRFSEELEQWLMEERDQLPALMRARVENLIAECRAVAKKMHAVEWFASGDYGIESFNEEWMEAQEGKDNG